MIITKIFRSETLQKAKKKIKAKKAVNRVRNKYVNFRLTQEEYDLLNQKVELSGLLKQDYIIQCLMNFQIKIRPDYRPADSVAKELFQLARVIKKYGRLEDEDQELLLFVLEIYEELKKEKSL